MSHWRERTSERLKELERGERKGRETGEWSSDSERPYWCQKHGQLVIIYDHRMRYTCSEAGNRVTAEPEYWIRRIRKPLATPKKVIRIVLGGSVRHPPLAHGVPAQRDTNRIGAGGYVGFAGPCRMDLALADRLTRNGGRRRSRLVVQGALARLAGTNVSGYVEGGHEGGLPISGHLPLGLTVAGQSQKEMFL